MQAKHALYSFTVADSREKSNEEAMSNGTCTLCLKSDIFAEIRPSVKIFCWGRVLENGHQYEEANCKVGLATTTVR